MGHRVAGKGEGKRKGAVPPRSDTEVTFPFFVQCNGFSKTIEHIISKTELEGITAARLPFYDRYSEIVANAFVEAMPDPYTLELPPGILKVETHYNAYAALEALKKEHARYIKLTEKEQSAFLGNELDYDDFLQILSFYLGSGSMEPGERLKVIQESLASLPMIARHAVQEQVPRQVRIACQTLHHQTDSSSKPKEPSPLALAAISKAQSEYLRITDSSLRDFRVTLVSRFALYFDLLRSSSTTTPHPLVREFSDLLMDKTKIFEPTIQIVLGRAGGSYEKALQAAQKNKVLLLAHIARERVLTKMGPERFERVLPTMVTSLDCELAARIVRYTAQLYGHYDAIDKLTTEEIRTSVKMECEPGKENYETLVSTDPDIFTAHFYFSSSKLSLVPYWEGRNKKQARALPYLWMGSDIPRFLVMNNSLVVQAVVLYQLATLRGNHEETEKFEKRLRVLISISIDGLALAAQKATHLNPAQRQQFAAAFTGIEVYAVSDIVDFINKLARYAQKEVLGALKDRHNLIQFADELIAEKSKEYTQYSESIHTHPILIACFAQSRAEFALQALGAVEQEESDQRLDIVSQRKLLTRQWDEEKKKLRLHAQEARDRASLTAHYTQGIFALDRTQFSLQETFQRKGLLELESRERQGIVGETQALIRRQAVRHEFAGDESGARLDIQRQQERDLATGFDLLRKEHLFDEERQRRREIERTYFTEHEREYLTGHERLSFLEIEREYSAECAPPPPPSPPVVGPRVAGEAPGLSLWAAAFVPKSGSPHKDLRPCLQKTLVKPALDIVRSGENFESLFCQARFMLSTCLHSCNPLVSWHLKDHGVTLAQLKLLCAPPPHLRVPLGFSPEQFNQFCLAVTSLIPAGVQCFLTVYGTAADFYSANPRKPKGTFFRAAGSGKAVRTDTSDIDIGLLFVKGAAELGLKKEWYPPWESGQLIMQSFIPGAAFTRERDQFLGRAGLKLLDDGSGYWNFADLPYRISFSVRTIDNPVFCQYEAYRIKRQLR